MACDFSLKREAGTPYAYHQQNRTLLSYMNIQKTAGLHKRIQNLAMKPLLAIRFWWRHGPLTPEAAERVDRIWHPKKYTAEVSSAGNPCEYRIAISSSRNYHLRRMDLDSLLPEGAHRMKP
jgi:hypothetical protein